MFDQAQDTISAMGKTLKGKLSGQGKKKSKTRSSGKSSSKSRRVKSEPLNGQLEDAWNVWHQGDTNLAHLFSSSTKHARHAARYNTTSLYAAYTDTRCFDCLKKHNRYRSLKRPYFHFLDLYRRHSPFPVYLSILKSNGPLCYRHYPDSSCGVIPTSANRNFKTQLYRFAQLWAIIGLLIALFAAIYQRLTGQRHAPSASHQDFDRSTKEKPALSNVSASTTKVQKLSSIPSQTFSSNTAGTHYSARALDERVDTQLRIWLERERNDGFRTISESCRMAINNTFLKQLVSPCFFFFRCFDARPTTMTKRRRRIITFFDFYGILTLALYIISRRRETAASRSSPLTIIKAVLFFCFSMIFLVLSCLVYLFASHQRRSLSEPCVSSRSSCLSRAARGKRCSPLT